MQGFPWQKFKITLIIMNFWVRSVDEQRVAGGFAVIIIQRASIISGLRSGVAVVAMHVLAQRGLLRQVSPRNLPPAFPRARGGAIQGAPERLLTIKSN